MSAAPFDFTPLLAPGLPAAAAHWTGRVKYDFTGGHNDADRLPLDGLIEAANTVLRREGRTLATYGLNSGPQGYRPLREFLVTKLKTDADISCTADDILITSGSLQGLDLVNRLLLTAGDTVIIEEDCYQGSINRLLNLGVTVIGMPLDDGGMRIDALTRTLADLAAKGVKPKYIYTVPTVQNPTATVMPIERRRQMLQLADRHGVPIFEDDCYCDLVWEGPRPPAIYALSGNANVIHIGSFSKSIAPALRLGFIVAPWGALSRMIALKTDAGSGALEQMVLAEYASANFFKHLPVLRQALRSKADTLMNSLRQSFGDAAQFDHPKGGIFLWIKLPDAVDAMKLYQHALAAGVCINPGPEWSVNKAHAKSRVRLCFANASHEEIQQGVAALADVCRREFGVPK